MYYSNKDEDFEKRQNDWNTIENLVLSYKKQFEENATQEEIQEAKESATKLLDKFSPLFTKYLTTIKTGQLDWHDKDIKLFVCNFIDDYTLQKALKRKKQNSNFKKEIYLKFNFIKETYGSIPEEDILLDLQTLLLTIAHRYKQMGRNFCSYVYNAYRYEVSRHIKKFTKNPLNIHYKKMQYEDCINGKLDVHIEDSYEDKYYEDVTGIPNDTWILGDSCSDIFNTLTPLDRKILIKYYLEEWKDKQIADFFGMHINTVNQRRRNATKIIASNCGIDINDIKRTRRSGKKAILPLNQ